MQSVTSELFFVFSSPLISLLCSAQSRKLPLTALARVKYKRTIAWPRERQAIRGPISCLSRVPVYFLSFSLLRLTPLTTIRACVPSLVLPVSRLPFVFIPPSVPYPLYPKTDCF